MSSLLGKLERKREIEKIVPWSGESLEDSIRLRNRDRVQVDQIEAISLILSFGHVLNLKDVVYVPSMRRNLISVVALDHDGYFCHFGNGKL